MGARSISYTKRLEDGNEYSGQVTYNMPEGVESKVQAWGESVVDSKVEQSVVIDVQAMCRRAKDAEHAQELTDSYIPGVARVRATGGVSKKAISDKIKEMQRTDPEKLKALLAELGLG